MSEITSWSAVATVEALKARKVSAVEVTQAHLDRLEALNPALNAIVDAVPDALERAKAIDAGTISGGMLHGAPVTTKINADQAGLANTNGLPANKDNIAAEDSAVVSNLFSAGAVVIGRTNTPEMSLRWCTSNPLHGVTLNPWDKTITPGGSSGGASASVASGIGVIAHGNDLGGSLRYPAFACGIASIKPSLGRIPAFNGTAPSRPPITSVMSTQGPIARSVADVRLGLAAMSAGTSRDANWSPARASYRSRTGDITVGLAPSPFAAETHPHQLKAMALAAQGLRDAGIKTREIDLPETALASEVWNKLLFTETEIIAGDAVKQTGSPELINLLNNIAEYSGGIYDLEGYIKGQMERMRLQRVYAQLFDEVDLVMLPTSLIPPYENDLDFKDRSKAGMILDAQAPLYLVNLLGLPSVALPTHVQDGLPLGVQLMGPQYDDDFALDVAERLEGELGSVLGQMPEPFRL
ncbi:hypothetical protein KO498_07710 [Lentibacter algarum]|uniref:amidase n=1 Tax=Lentibacter algarum TaxID=576131 RepID=UPI001C065308|nr:amidase [Lentibacter algarum]MBU2981700.1 hypothetical protein [Lentibacter algarum]